MQHAPAHALFLLHLSYNRGIYMHTYELYILHIHLSLIYYTYIRAVYNIPSMQLHVYATLCMCVRVTLYLYICVIYCVYIYVFMFYIYIYIDIHRYIYIYIYIYMLCIYIYIYIYYIICVCVYMRVFFLDRLGLVITLSLFLSVLLAVWYLKRLLLLP
jgi:hypothetical protein